MKKHRITDLRKSNGRESVLPSLNDLRDRKDYY